MPERLHRRRRSGSGGRSRRSSSNGGGSRYSARAWLVALFVVLAIVLGGGGSPNPATELLLEISFAAIALAWFWLPGKAAEANDALHDRWVWALIIIPLIVPAVQLVPLPPSIWSGLPGRENELAALSLINEQSSWRPLSLSPSRTLASLLASVPSVFCLYAVARLNLNERRLILGTVGGMAIVSAWLGAVQLTAGGAVNFYPQHSAGWVTGFQANRNAEADVLLIGLLACVVLVVPYLTSEQRKLPLGLTKRAFAMLTGGVALFLLAAIAMTGSRAGTALIAIACAGAVLIFSVSRSSIRRSLSPVTLAVLILAVLLGCGAVLVALSQNTALARVAARFSDLGSERGEIWQDSWFALKQYWPVGFGMGGFEPAMLPAERLEYLDALIPNRAHNDFLEIGIEAGLLGYAMVAAAVTACLALALRAWRASPENRGQVVFALSVLMLTVLHSLVDYPLRSMAVASLCGVAGGLLVRTRKSTQPAHEFGRFEVVRGLA